MPNQEGAPRTHQCPARAYPGDGRGWHHSATSGRAPSQLLVRRARSTLDRSTLAPDHNGRMAHVHCRRCLFRHAASCGGPIPNSAATGPAYSSLLARSLLGSQRAVRGKHPFHRRAHLSRGATGIRRGTHLDQLHTRARGHQNATISSRWLHLQYAPHCPAQPGLIFIRFHAWPRHRAS